MQYSYSGLWTAIGISAYKRNDFHLRGAISMVTKWRIVRFQTEKENSAGNIIRTRNSNGKYDEFLDRSRLLVFADHVIFFVLSSLVSLRTCIHGYQQETESCCCVDSRPFQREKRLERCGTRRGIVCCAFRSCGGTSAKASAQKIVLPGCSQRQGKTRRETKTSMLQHKKNPDHLIVVVSPSNFRRVVGVPSTVNRHKPKQTSSGLVYKPNRNTIPILVYPKGTRILTSICIPKPE